MKAIVYERYGPPEVLHLKDVPTPEIGDDDLLVKVRATSVRTGDWRMRKPDPALARLFNGLFRPKRKILGFELAGDVTAVGQNVTRFAVGDAVFASCGLEFGAYAEYKCLSETAVVAHKPENMTYAEAAAVPSGALAALPLLRDEGQIQAGQNVLIYGASGSVGTYAVQLARTFGAVVTAVTSSTNLDWVQALGADTVIDYTRDDITQRPERYDLIFDAVGKLITGKSRSVFQRVLAPGGKYVSIDSGYTESADDLWRIKELVEGEQVTAVIDRIYPWDQIVAAHRYVEGGHKKGNVVITITAD